MDKLHLLRCTFSARANVRNQLRCRCIRLTVDVPVNLLAVSKRLSNRAHRLSGSRNDVNGPRTPVLAFSYCLHLASRRLFRKLSFCGRI